MCKESLTKPSFLMMALRWTVIKRSLVVAAIVGTILVLINHGTCVMTGCFGSGCWIRSGLSVLVPYLVSTISSVLAEREHYGTPSYPNGAESTDSP